MNTSSVLLPLRVPELGPSLGKLITGSGRQLDGFSLEPFRYQLVTKVIDLAGEARRLAVNNERDAALATVGREAWLGAWNETVTAVAAGLGDQLDAHLEAEAKAVRMTRRRRRRLMLGAAQRRAITARLGSAGSGLITVLDDLEEQCAAARDATALERDAVEDWQAALTLSARRLEAAWLAMETAVAHEIKHWRSTFEEVARWRKPWWPVVVVGMALFSVAIWLGLIRGGFLAPPDWLPQLWNALRR